MTSTTTKTLRILVALAAVLTLCIGLTACQGEQTTASTTSTKLEIGAKDNAYALELTNSSGKSVVGIALKLPGEATHGANLLSSSQHLTNGETATIYVPKGQTTNGEYLVEIKVTFVDGGVSNLHHLDMEDFTAATLLLKGKVGYVSYQSKAAKRLVNTLELQTYYYNLEDPTAAARDAEEEEQEKRRLEKLEEDLKSQEETSGNTTNSSNGTSTSGTTNETQEDVQDNSLEDDPIETNWDGPESPDD